MSEKGFGLDCIADRVSEVRGALVFESSGIEVASWGDIDPETGSAEFAELLGILEGMDSLQVLGRPAELRFAGESAQWFLFPLGSEYILALLADPEAVPGKVRFYADGWIASHRKDFP